MADWAAAPPPRMRECLLRHHGCGGRLPVGRPFLRVSESCDDCCCGVARGVIDASSIFLHCAHESWSLCCDCCESDAGCESRISSRTLMMRCAAP